MMKQATYSHHNKIRFFPRNGLFIQQTKAAIKSIFLSGWRRLSSLLTARNEPHVWQTERNGKTIWHGYDPSTGKKVTRSSEKEMLIWLEERYYQ